MARAATQAGASGQRIWTAREVRGLGVRTDVATAGEIIGGLSRTQAYVAVEHGKFPVPVVRVGRRLVVPTAPILALLGIDPDTDVAGPATPPGPATTPTETDPPSPRGAITTDAIRPDRH